MAVPTCCMSKKTQRHVSMILWRIRLYHKRKRMTLFWTYYFSLIGLILLAVTYKPPIIIPEGNNFEYMRTINSSNWQAQQTKLMEPRELKATNIDENQLGSNWQQPNTAVSFGDDLNFIRDFAHNCQKQKQDTIAVVGQGQKLEIARAIYQRMLKKYSGTVDHFFKEKIFESEDELNNYQKDPSLSFEVEQGTVCLGIGAEQWNERDQTTDKSLYSVKIFYPAFQYNQFLSSNLTTSESTMSFDFDSYYLFMNTSLIEVMTVATEQVIEDVNMVDQLRNGSFQLKLLPTYQISSKSMNQVVYHVSKLFINYVINPLPFAASGIMLSALDYKQEADLWQLQKSMGMKQVSWLLAYLIVVTGGTLIFTTLFGLVVKFMALKQTDITFFLVTIYAYSYVSIFQLIFMIAAFGFMGIVIYFLLGLFSFIINIIMGFITMLPSYVIILLCPISPQLVFSNLMQNMLLLDTREGLRWSNSSVMIQDNNNLYNLVALAATSLLYILLTIWIWPIKFVQDGKKRSACYCINPSYWFSQSKQPLPKINSQSLMLKQLDQQLDQENLLLRDERDLVERGDMEIPQVQDFVSNDQQYLADTLRIKNLVKEFKNNDKETMKQQKMKRAINDLSLSMFKNQIFALLGHNGAGKTTTMSILSGQLNRTQGQASAFGHDIFVHQDQMHDITGICPQKDVLIENITVYENLYYFCSIRMMEPNQIEKYISYGIDKLQLQTKKDSIVKTLSGGQKRKVQLLIALAGNVKFVLLDEPSSGMDPTARKDTWDLIKTQSKGKIMILTTHYMDEAEALGDRIGIMSQGQLKVCGSALFLKNRYGLGTILEIQLLDASNTDMSKLEQYIENFQRSDKLEDDQIIEESKDIIVKGNSIYKGPVTQIKGKIDENNLFVIKLPVQLNPHFKSIFEDLDKPQFQQEMNIKNYNVRVTSLEEVFNALGEQELSKQSKDNLGANQLDHNDLEMASQPIPVKTLTNYEYTQLIFANRMMIFRRNKQYLTHLIIPTAIVLLFLNLFVSPQLKPLESISLSSPLTIFNQSSVGDYSIGLPINGDSVVQSDLKIETIQNAVCNQQTGIVCQQVDNQVQGMNTTLNAMDFQKDAFFESNQKSKVLNGQIFIGDQKGTLTDKDYQLTLYMMSNLSQPVSTPMLAAQGLNTIAQHFTNDQNVQMKFEFVPLSANPIIASSQFPNPPVQSLGITSILLNFMLIYAYSDIGNLLSQRESGILRQYLLMGAPVNAFLQSNAMIVAMLTIINTALMVGFFEFTELYYRAVLPVMLLSAIALPIESSYQFLQNPQTSSQIVLAKIYGFPKLLLFVIGSGICFIISNDFWIVAICLETIFSVSPFFAVNMAWVKVSYGYYYWQASSNPYPNIVFQWWSFNGVLPEIIGLFVCTLYNIIGIVRVSRNGVHSKSSDGHELKIRQNRHKYATVSDADLNQDSSEFMADELVQEERLRVEKIMQGQLPSETLTVSNLKKFYIVNRTTVKNKQNDQQDNVDNQNDEFNQQDSQNGQNKEAVVKALRGISFSLQKGECFILLGVNGAGKTTTFKCLSTDELLTQGSIMIEGRPIQSFKGQSQNFANIIGYCPQVSPIDSDLTVKEKLVFLGQLIGLKNDVAEKYARLIAKKFEIYQFYNTFAHQLSGGNQRKLMTAIAMFTSPRLIMLDEASAGVDPFSRRRLWKTIREQGQNSALVITTHSMEEAEALGSKMAIQVDGKFRCFGSAQQIKLRFGQGFSVILKLNVKKLEDRVDLFSQSNINQKDLRTFVSISERQEEIDRQINTQQIDSEAGVPQILQTMDDEMGYMTLEKVKQRITQWFHTESGLADQSEEFTNFIADQFNNELTPTGMLSVQYNQIAQGLAINLQLLFKQILLLSQISQIMTALEDEFSGTVSLIDFTGNQLSLKIQNTQEKSIGYLYGFIEQMKQQTDKYVIKEYQAEQTTLEQVFNQFAKERSLTRLNQSLKNQSNIRKKTIKQPS